MKNADVILLLQEKLPQGHLVDWYETMSMVLETLPGEPEFDIVNEEFVVTTGNFAASFKAVSDGIEIQTLTSFGEKPSGYRITVPNDLKLVKALEALYNKAHAPEYKPNEVSSLDRYYFAGAQTMSRRPTAVSYSEVTEQELLNAINESEIKIDLLEEEGQDIAAREERLVLDELLAMYGDDEWEETEEGTAIGLAPWDEDEAWEDDERWASSTKRTDAPTQPPETLAQALQALIDAARAEWDEVMEGLSNPQDEYADVQIFVGEEAQHYSEGASVVMTYDGAGYDMLSYQGEMEHMGGSDLRVKVKNVAAEMGYMTEDQDNVSMAFYPDESAEVYHPPKREIPKWMRDDLEAEFGPFGTEASVKNLFDPEALRLGSVLKQRFANRFATNSGAPEDDHLSKQ